MTAKEQIIDLFRKNVKGQCADVKNKNERHDGKKGHWLEEQFLISANANNSPDILGYELKNETTSKTTFGDWSANEYIFKTGVYASLFKGSNAYEKQDSFCCIFGSPNPKKNNRCSWSGRPCPKIGSYNEFGQILVIEPNKDIVAYYSFSQDRRINKASIIPVALQRDNLEIARWYGVSDRNGIKTDKCLCSKLENKFGDKGWFTCKTDSFGRYKEICFGDPFNFDQWLNLVAKGIVFFDSGMYQGNKRPYSQWRANNTYWDSLIVERYK